MTQRLLLLDNDAFILLSGAGVLLETIELLGYEADHSRRLASLPFMLRKPAQSLRHLPADVLQRALEDCDRIPALELSPPQEMLSMFEGHSQDIDEGEVVLMGVAAVHSLHLLASNDKRALRGLVKQPALKGIRDALAGRVVCLEAIVRKMILIHGPVKAEEKLKAMVTIDKRISTILSPVTTGRPDDCLLAVDSFLTKLRGELGAGFLKEL